MAKSKVLLYAELLPNIRQISVIVALDPPLTSTTKGQLSADGHQIVLSHGEEKYILNLPGQAVPTTQLQKPVVGSKEISWRLPVAGMPSHAGAESAQNNDAPWSAKDLGPSSEFFCRRCNAIIMPKGLIKSWRDLPSENWAEMMDFWHCHKPDPETDGENSQAGHHHTEDSNANRGYGANTKFIAQPGIGFVDLTSFLLVDSDCQNLQALLIPEIPSSSGTLHLWILQQSLFYTSSESGTRSRTFAMKILWKRINEKETTTLLDDGKAEDVVLPADAVMEIEKCLRDTSRFLPPSARIFQGWDVGLLERYQNEQERPV
ncbi:hypothetical protein EG329_008374 [Mollisiaceae sp. DMI_Dod_QoI]|nr:hypothetical protein EG329_008374 [Helotiales sp. DMI_Dod_QoI]